MVKESGRVRDGLRDSAWTLLSSDGQTQTRVYSKGILVSTQSNNGNPPTPSADSGYSPVEQVPEFPGGLDAFARFLSKNVGYPNQARDNNVTGRVLISFVVEKDGTLSEIKVAKGIGSGCDEEALRVMKLSPNWKPGIQNGHPVRVAYSVPINFAGSN
jgi:TonB family protein